MPAHNAAMFIREAIASVTYQTMTDWELVVVDDASADLTPVIVSELACSDRRISLIRSQGGKVGVAKARNRGLSAAVGRYVAFLDSDDLWSPHKLTRQIGFLDSTGGQLTYGSYNRMTADGRSLGLVVPPQQLTYDKMLRSNFIANLTGIFDRTNLPQLFFEAVGNEDYLFWLRAMEAIATPVFRTPGEGALGSYRVTLNSLSANKIRSASWQWQIYRSHLGLNHRKSLKYFSSYVFHSLSKRFARSR